MVGAIESFDSDIEPSFGELQFTSVEIELTDLFTTDETRVTIRFTKAKTIANLLFTFARTMLIVQVEQIRSEAIENNVVVLAYLAVLLLI